jgi:hypothetical protein
MPKDSDNGLILQGENIAISYTRIYTADFRQYFSQTTTSNTFSTGGLGNNNGFPPAQTQQKKTNQKGGLDDSTKVIYGQLQVDIF